MLFSLILTIVISLIQLDIDYKNGLKAINTQLDFVDAAYRASLEHGLWVDDKQQLHLLMNGILHLPDIQYIQIKLNDGTLIAEGQMPGESPLSRELALNYQYGDRIVPVGVMEITADLKGLYAQLTDKMIVILFSQSIKTFLTAFFILFLAQYLIIRHLQTIVKFSRGMDIVHLKEPLFLQKKDRHDELDEVVSAFNFMRQKIKSKVETLAQLNAQLDEKVMLRTQELQASLDELKATQDQLIQSEKMAALGGLVAGVAHEINTPIGLSITGITHLRNVTQELRHLYTTDVMTKADFEAFLDDCASIYAPICINLQRTAELVSSFKMVATDQSRQEKYTFALHERIDQVLVSIRNRLRETNVSVKVTCDETLCIYSDPGALVQVFTNLLMNSLTHGFAEHDTGEISIHAHAHHETLTILYTDSGVGIAPDVLPKIFDPFFTTNREAGGTGLGMHIVFNIIVSQLDGAIEVCSEVGKGVKFVIVLPLQSE